MSENIKIEEHLLSTLLHSTSTGIHRGIEKEGLRVNSECEIAKTSHPKALGSALTHPSITTDYSEALLEFISPVQKTAKQSIEFLKDLHCYSSRNMGDEVVWPASMPCKLNGDESVAIATYGSSNVGNMKHVYRQGLGARYGRVMQSIAGIHYNVSFSDDFWNAYQQISDSTLSLKDFKSEQYFKLIRNFKRHSWLLHYLFGASPVLDKSFLKGRKHSLEALLENTYGLEYATSLRMSDLGYQNSVQESVEVVYCSLEQYLTTLGNAVKQSHPTFEKIGIKVDGEYKQLNSNILQLENEFYSDIRPKRVTSSGEKPIHALRSRGVEYVEVRVLDINPFLEVGINEQQIAFLDTFLVYCLLLDDTNKTALSIEEIRDNHRKVIMQGRKPSLMLTCNGEQAPLKAIASELLDNLQCIANAMDDVEKTTDYSKALDAQRLKVEKPELTPSGQVMALVKQGNEFIDIAQKQANQYKQKSVDYFESTEGLDKSYDESMLGLAKKSLADQKAIEDSDTMTFDEYLDAYNMS